MSTESGSSSKPNEASPLLHGKVLSSEENNEDDNNQNNNNVNTGHSTSTPADRKSVLVDDDELPANADEYEFLYPFKKALKIVS